jgi:hypothetical protein
MPSNPWKQALLPILDAICCIPTTIARNCDKRSEAGPPGCDRDRLQYENRVKNQPQGELRLPPVSVFPRESTTLSWSYPIPQGVTGCSRARFQAGIPTPCNPDLNPVERVWKPTRRLSACHAVNGRRILLPLIVAPRSLEMLQSGR